MMKQISSQNKTLIITFVIAVVFVGILVFGGDRKKGGSSDESPIDESKPQTTDRVNKLDMQTIWSSFPAGFPVEEGITSDNSFKYIPANSLVNQFTIEYRSQKTLSENVKIFKDYLETSGFEIANSKVSSNQAFFYATADNNDLSILIKSETDKVTVSASYLKR